MDVVEVSPPYDHAEMTAMAAHRAVLEAISALAVRKASGTSVRFERPAAGGPAAAGADSARRPQPAVPTRAAGADTAAGAQTGSSVPR